MTRRKRNYSSRKTEQTERTRPPRESQIKIVKDELTPREIARKKRAKREKERVYKRRRMTLTILGLLLVIIPSFLIIKRLNTYAKTGYPNFRDEVLKDLSTTAFVSSTEGRSLTSAEKNSDFDILYKTIVRNFAIDKSNAESFDEFTKKSEEYRKKITGSKTDQDFFLLLGEYLSLLSDSYTKILDKDSYTDLFNYYKNKSGSPMKEILENPQVVNRYKRIINEKNVNESSVGIENGYILRISLPNFRVNDIKKTIDEIIKSVTAAPGISTMVIDLSDNNSLNNLFVNEFAKYFIHQDYTKDDLIFYRGNLLENTLKDIKADDNSAYKTAFVKNLTSKYKDKIDYFDLNPYMYYDQISLNIKKDSTFASRNIYILTNANTANEAIKLASILKESSNACVVKNALDPNPTAQDRIYEFPPSLFVLDHSGLVISLNTARAERPNRYLEYNQRINSKYPISSMLSIVR